MSTAPPSPEEFLPPPAPRRSAATWLLVLLVWGVGLVVWVGYLAVIVLLLIRIL
jgi:hypothetical protein